MKEKLLKVGVNLARLVIAATFTFSGYVKAIDPLGTQYKITDYLGAVGLQGMLPDWLTLALSVALSATEFTLGVMMLFAIHRRLTAKATLGFMLIMTPVTLWLYLANPVEDCGCFGDAVKLSNGETLLKNLVLTACAVVTLKWHCFMRLIFLKRAQWIIINGTLLFIGASSLYSLYFLPPFDFRPYHVGANIRKGMEIPQGAEQPKFETTFLLRKNGETREFTLENYPDSTWEFVDSKTVQTSKGYVPPIHDFSIVLNETGEDITEQVLDAKQPVLLLVAPHLEQADDSNFGQIDQIYELAHEQGWHMYCLTASGERAIARWIDMTGAEYPFCTTDDITLKTIVRSNPGLLMLQQGVIVGKWSHNRLPSEQQLMELAQGKTAHNN
jgi:triosephosphate isomerase